MARCRTSGRLRACSAEASSRYCARPTIGNVRGLTVSDRGSSRARCPSHSSGNGRCRCNQHCRDRVQARRWCDLNMVVTPVSAWQSVDGFGRSARRVAFAMAWISSLLSSSEPLGNLRQRRREHERWPAPSWLASRRRLAASMLSETRWSLAAAARAPTRSPLQLDAARNRNLLRLRQPFCRSREPASSRVARRRSGHGVSDSPGRLPAGRSSPPGRIRAPGRSRKRTPRAGRRRARRRHEKSTPTNRTAPVSRPCMSAGSRSCARSSACVRTAP